MNFDSSIIILLLLHSLILTYANNYTTSYKSNHRKLTRTAQNKSKLHPPIERIFKRKKRLIAFPNYCAMKLTLVLGKSMIAKYPRGLNVGLEVSLYYPVPTIWQEWFPKHLRPSVRKKPTVARAKFPQFVPRVKADNNSETLQYVDTLPSSSPSSSSSNLDATLINNENNHHITYPIHLYHPYHSNSVNMNFKNPIPEILLTQPDASIYVDGNAAQVSGYKLHNNDKLFLKNSNLKWQNPQYNRYDEMGQQQQVTRKKNYNRINSTINYNNNDDGISNDDAGWWNGNKFTTQNWMKKNYHQDKNAFLKSNLGSGNQYTSMDSFNRYKNYENQWNAELNKRKWSKYTTTKNYNHYYNHIKRQQIHRRSLYNEKSSFRINENTMTSTIGTEKLTTFSPLIIKREESEKIPDNFQFHSSIFNTFSIPSIEKSSTSSFPLSLESISLKNFTTTTTTSSKRLKSLISNSLNDSISYVQQPDSVVVVAKNDDFTSHFNEKNQYQVDNKNLNRNWWQLVSIQNQQHKQQKLQIDSTPNQIYNKNWSRPPSVLWSKSDNFNSSSSIKNNQNYKNNQKYNNSNNNNSSSNSSNKINKSKVNFSTNTSNKQIENITNNIVLNPYNNNTNEMTTHDNDGHTDDDDADDDESQNHDIERFNTSKINYWKSQVNDKNKRSKQKDTKFVVNDKNKNFNWNKNNDRDNEYNNNNEDDVDDDDDNDDDQYEYNYEDEEIHFNEIYRQPLKYFSDLEKHKNWKHYRGHRDRRDIYTLLEDFNSMLSVSMKSCILRSICEAKRYLLPPGYSLLQDILRILFSVPTKDDLNDDYSEAMKSDVYSCELKYIKACPISLLDILMHRNLG